MANKTITIAWTNGAPRFNPPPGVTFLFFGDKVTVQLTGVPNGQGSIDEVTIYANQVVNGVDTKGSQLCGWTRSGTNGCKMYGIAPASDTVVIITDNERPTADTKYWFSASGTRPSAWSLDPELVNQPGGPG